MPEAHNKRSACTQSSRTKQGVSPPSPTSDDGAVKQGAEDEVKIQCFFAVLDPENTAKLKGSKHSACLNGFSSVNRLREHMWRAHSPTHNCQHCRKKTTAKPTEEFRKEHARCRPGAITTSRPFPTLISTAQAVALQNLNQHFNKPNDEVVRCKKLLGALFPEVKFEKERFMSSHNTAGANGSKANTKSAHTSPSPKQKNQRQPQTPTTVSRPQNTTPPASPPAAAPERPVVHLGRDVDISPRFPTVAVPSEGTFSTKPHTSSRASRDSGLGTEPSHYDPPSPVEKRLGTPDRQESLGHGRRKSSGESGTEMVGVQFRAPKPVSKPVYPQRVLEEGDIEMEEDTAPAVQEHFGVNLNVGISSRAAYDSRSEYSESTTSQTDTDMERSERGYSSDYDMDMPDIQGPDDVLVRLHRQLLNAGSDEEGYDSFHDSSEPGSDSESDS